MTRLRWLFPLIVGVCFAAPPQRWSGQKAAEWYKQQPWLVGSNFVPANAINELEMWQAATFDPKRIDTELAWAESLGMNTMRVFLHDLLWQEDPAGFTRRIDEFLKIAERHHIRPMFVLFDSVWDPNPRLGPQRAPRPGVHNSGWVQSPGLKALEDKSQYPRLEKYVKGVVGAFRSDKRVLAWDIWNEPDNENGAYKDPAEKKSKLILELLPRAFEWARAANPEQPLTSGVYQGAWSGVKMAPVTKVQIDSSDVISFHSYDPPAEFNARVAELEPYGRPLLCTEYMARSFGSTFEAILPIMKNKRIAAYNWGFVQGKSQTNLPWDSWKHPYVDQPPKVWFHDIFYPDGKPYRQNEVDLIRKLTGRAAAMKPAA